MTLSSTDIADVGIINTGSFGVNENLRKATLLRFFHSRERNVRPHQQHGTTETLQLKPAGAKIGAPWLNWHTLRRTQCTLFQEAGGSLRDAQAQLGHSKMSTTLEVYTIPIDARRREVVEKLGVLVTNGDEAGVSMQGLRMPTTQIQ